MKLLNPGTVYLNGAGPGDPGLITVRGRELLETSDVVVYDRLAHPGLLRHARPDAERVYVGKSSARHAMRQPDINALLIDRALKGRSVARLQEHGRAADTPVALVQWGTWTRQRVVTGTLGTIVDAVSAGDQPQRYGL